MGVWLALLVAGVIGGGLALKRRSTLRQNIHAGQVSESWLREHRAEKQDRFPS